MGTWKRRFAGKKAKIEGSSFEGLIDLMVRREGGTVVTIPTGCRVLSITPRGPRVVLVPTPYDKMIVFDKDKTLFIDAKSFDSDRITYSNLVEHQVRSLYELEQRGHLAGYLVFFRKVQKVGFIKASILHNMKPRESIEYGMANLCGSSVSFTLNHLFSR